MVITAIGSSGGVYSVRWRVEMEAVVIGAESEQEATERASDCDPVKDGEYVTDSFEVIKVTKII